MTEIKAVVSVKPVYVKVIHSKKIELRIDGIAERFFISFAVLRILELI